MKWFFIITGLVVAFAFGFVANDMSTEKEIARLKDIHAIQIMEVEDQSVRAVNAAIKAQTQVAEVELLLNQQIDLLTEELKNYDDTSCAKQNIPDHLLN